MAKFKDVLTLKEQLDGFYNRGGSIEKLPEGTKTDRQSLRDMEKVLKAKTIKVHNKFDR